MILLLITFKKTIKLRYVTQMKQTKIEKFHINHESIKLNKKFYDIDKPFESPLIAYIKKYSNEELSFRDEPYVISTHFSKNFTPRVKSLSPLYSKKNKILHQK